MDEFRIFGPPGTGKTSRLATRDVPRAVDKYGPDKVMITSFTRAAARKIATQKSLETGLPIDVHDGMVGTLHSICYHALGQPQIMEVDHIKDWNYHNPDLAVTKQISASMDMVMSADDCQLSTEHGNFMLSAMNIYRNKMLPETMWHINVRTFKKKWDDFKAQIGAVDFTELIETAINDLPYAPGRPEVLFIDEAQDSTRLQLKLARNWGMEMQWIVLVGDDDQTIYQFTGADPYAFLLPPVPDNRKTILKQSYRVPMAVLERAQNLIRQVKSRESKEYMPRMENGKIAVGQVNDRDFAYNNPDEIITEAADYAKDGHSVMILASCSYMLDEIKAKLKDSGIPFGNEYRKTRADWNPLASKINGVSAKDLLLNFNDCGSDAPYWNVAQFVNWVQFIKTGPEGIKYGKKRKGIKALKLAIEENEPGLHTCKNVISQMLEPVAITQALDRNLDWLVQNLDKSRQQSILYPIDVLKKFGSAGIKQTPKITLGTIHSVKGAEADIVYLFPDISWKANMQYQTNIGRDNIRRVFYVGMTRTKHVLNIAKPKETPHKHPTPFIEF